MEKSRNSFSSFLLVSLLSVVLFSMASTDANAQSRGRSRYRTRTTKTTQNRNAVRKSETSSKDWIYGRWVGYYKGCKVELIFTENTMTEKYDGQTAYSGSYVYQSQGFIAYNLSRPGQYQDMWPFDVNKKVMLLDNSPMQKYSY